MTVRVDRVPTVLEAELRRRRWSREDAARELTRAARDLGIVGGWSLSLRQLDRWLSGEVRIPRGVACRVAEHVFGRPIEVLLGPVRPVSADPESEAPVAPATVGEFVVRSGEASRDHAAMAAAGAVAPATLEQLHAEVRRLAHAYASTPPLGLLSQLMRTRDLAYELLSHTRRPSQLSELYLVAGQVCGLAATTAFDLGHRDAAEDHGRAAWTYGDLIDHPALRAYARGVQATIAFWSGRPGEGLRYVNSGLTFAHGPAAVRLHAIGARAYAMLGAAGDARQALRLAMETADRGERGDEMTDEVGGEFAFGRPRFALCAGAVNITLGDGRSAAHAAGEALRLYGQTSAEQKRWAVHYGAWMDLATAHALQDNLDGAAEALAPALRLDKERRTARLAQRLVMLRATVDRSRYRGSAVAHEVSSAIDDFNACSLAWSVRQALPAGS
ncbi:hypothetical protein [Phytohabitans kaempferiae]|uniref:Tat pathway signal protein n=1 Tax=Phytohabitans kaempferiae TaxID=1620943 RepID=A0ABV6M6T2_9ACTN